MKKILCIYGTRPEAIKFAPLIRAFQQHPKEFDIKSCVTAQHREMLDQVLSFFKIKPEFDLNLMTPNQTLFDITANCLKKLHGVLLEYEPDLIFVQGDTTTAFAGALAGFYQQIPVAHLEAGLRSHDLYSPFPEELNRMMVSRIAKYHFVPTPLAQKNLIREGLSKNISVVGNTVIDALFLGLKMIHEQGEQSYLDFFSFLDFSKRIILVTGHRRESFGEPFENICLALRELAVSFGDIEIVYPVHLNPKVRAPVQKFLKEIPNIHLIEPLDYPYLIWLMNKSFYVITDSGGIQEEAPSLGKPVLVMRDVTERQEGIDAKTAKLVGTNKDVILKAATELLTDPKAYQYMATAVNPYGDGTTSEQIVDILLSEPRITTD